MFTGQQRRTHNPTLITFGSGTVRIPWHLIREAAAAGSLHNKLVKARDMNGTRARHPAWPGQVQL